MLRVQALADRQSCLQAAARVTQRGQHRHSDGRAQHLCSLLRSLPADHGIVALLVYIENCTPLQLHIGLEPDYTSSPGRVSQARSVISGETGETECGLSLLLHRLFYTICPELSSGHQVQVPMICHPLSCTLGVKLGCSARPSPSGRSTRRFITLSALDLIPRCSLLPPPLHNGRMWQPSSPLPPQSRRGVRFTVSSSSPDPVLRAILTRMRCCFVSQR